MRFPSVSALSQVFADAKTARALLTMPYEALRGLPAAQKRIRECFNPPGEYDVRMHCLDAIDNGLFGLEAIEFESGEFADYLNAGDCDTPTLIYWRGRYRVQSLGDFVGVLERRGIRAK